MNTPQDVGQYWYRCAALGTVVATVTRERNGRLIAQYLERRWPVESQLMDGVWGQRAESEGVFAEGD